MSHLTYWEILSACFTGVCLWDIWNSICIYIWRKIEKGQI